MLCFRLNHMLIASPWVEDKTLDKSLTPARSKYTEMFKLLLILQLTREKVRPESRAVRPGYSIVLMNGPAYTVACNANVFTCIHSQTERLK